MRVWLLKSYLYTDTFVFSTLMWFMKYNINRPAHGHFWLTTMCSGISALFEIPYVSSYNNVKLETRIPTMIQIAHTFIV